MATRALEYKHTPPLISMPHASTYINPHDVGVRKHLRVQNVAPMRRFAGNSHVAETIRRPATGYDAERAALADSPRSPPTYDRRGIQSRNSLTAGECRVADWAGCRRLIPTDNAQSPPAHACNGSRFGDADSDEIGRGKFLGKGDWLRLPRSGPKGASHKRCLSPLPPRNVVRPTKSRGGCQNMATSWKIIIEGACAHRSPSLSAAELSARDVLMENTAARKRFDEQFVRSHRHVFRYIAALVPNRDDAEEVFQDTCLKILEKWRDYDAIRPMVPWACGIAQNMARKFYERNRRRGFR